MAMLKSAVTDKERLIAGQVHVLQHNLNIKKVPEQDEAYDKENESLEGDLQELNIHGQPMRQGRNFFDYPVQIK